MLVKILEDKGMHTRAAVSVNSLPLGVAVEIDAIFEIKKLSSYPKIINTFFFH